MWKPRRLEPLGDVSHRRDRVCIAEVEPLTVLPQLAKLAVQRPLKGSAATVLPEDCNLHVATGLDHAQALREIRRVADFHYRRSGGANDINPLGSGWLTWNVRCHGFRVITSPAHGRARITRSSAIGSFAASISISQPETTSGAVRICRHPSRRYQPCKAVFWPSGFVGQ